MHNLIFVLYDCLGSSTLTAHDTKEQIGAVRPHDIPTPAQSSVIKDGE